jgi:hypothetical protein
MRTRVSFSSAIANPRQTRIVKCLGVIATLFLWVTSSHASPISLRDPLIASQVIQGILPDSDVYFFTKFFGLSKGEVLNYQSNTDLQSLMWNGTLTGSYLQRPVSLSYSGNLSNITIFPPGPIAFVTNGTFDGFNVTGSGNASIVETTAGFGINFLYTLNVGNNTGVIDVNIRGSVIDQGQGQELLVIAPPSTDGTFTVNGTLEIKGDFTENYVYVNGKLLVGTDDIDFGDDTPMPVEISSIEPRALTGLEGTVGTTPAVPEPSTLILLVTGFFSLLGYCWIRPGSATARDGGQHS